MIYVYLFEAFARGRYASDSLQESEAVFATVAFLRPPPGRGATGMAISVSVTVCLSICPFAYVLLLEWRAPIGVLPCR